MLVLDLVIVQMDLIYTSYRLIYLFKKEILLT